MRHKRRTHGLSRKERLVNPADFARVYKAGKRAAGRTLVLYVLNNGENLNRVGFSVGTKRAGGVVRKNRIKRLLREAYRRNKTRFTTGWDLVMVPRKTTERVDFQVFQDELLALAKKAEVIIQ